MANIPEITIDAFSARRIAVYVPTEGLGPIFFRGASSGLVRRILQETGIDPEDCEIVNVSNSVPRCTCGLLKSVSFEDEKL